MPCYGAVAWKCGIDGKPRQERANNFMYTDQLCTQRRNEENNNHKLKFDRPPADPLKEEFPKTGQAEDNQQSKEGQQNKELNEITDTQPTCFCTKHNRENDESTNICKYSCTGCDCNGLIARYTQTSKDGKRNQCMRCKS